MAADTGSDKSQPPSTKWICNSIGQDNGFKHDLNDVRRAYTDARQRTGGSKHTSCASQPEEPIVSAGVAPSLCDPRHVPLAQASQPSTSLGSSWPGTGDFSSAAIAEPLPHLQQLMPREALRAVRRHASQARMGHNATKAAVAIGWDPDSESKANPSKRCPIVTAPAVMKTVAAKM